MATWPQLRKRQLDRVRALGFTDLTAFSEAHWGDTWMQLAARLDPAVIPAHLEQWLRAEAVAWGLVPRFLRGALLREFNKKLPNGWGPGDDWPATLAVSALTGELEGDWARVVAPRIWQHLKEHHPPHWKPRDPDDPLLVAAFEAADFPYEKVTSPFPIEARSSAPHFAPRPDEER